MPAKPPFVACSTVARNLRVLPITSSTSPVLIVFTPQKVTAERVPPQSRNPHLVQRAQAGDNKRAKDLVISLHPLGKLVTRKWPTLRTCDVTSISSVPIME